MPKIEKPIINNLIEYNNNKFELSIESYDIKDTANGTELKQR